MTRLDLLKQKAKATSLIEVIDKVTPGIEWKRKGMAKVTNCPFHNEQTPSFHVFEKDGQEFYKCHGCGESGDVIAYVTRNKDCNFVTALEIITDESFQDPNSTEYVITNYLKAQKKHPLEDGYFKVFNDVYFYHDSKNQLESCKIKYLTIDSKGNKVSKSFSQRRIKGDLIDFKSNLNKLPNTLYNLTQIGLKNNDGKTIYIVEGEKDCNTLIYKGLTATTPRESGEWTEDMIQVFAGANVVIIPDTGEAGNKRAKVVIAAIGDVVKSLKVCYPPGLANLGDNKDITDWFEAGNTKQQLLQHIKLYCLDIKNKNELQQDYHGVYYFKTEKIDGESVEVKKHLTNFKVLDVEHINNVDEENQSYKMTLENSYNEIITVTIDHESFIEVNSFNKSLRHMNFDFKGNSNMLKIFRLWLNYFVTTKITNYSINGIRKIKDEYLLITQHGAMNCKGEINKSLVSSNYLRPCDIPLVDAIDKVSLEELNKHLFSWNRSDVVNIQLGSAFAYSMVQHFDNNELKLHYAFSAGESGAGKSTLVENIIMPLTGLIGDFHKKSCSNSTYYTMTRNLSSTNLPVFYDEYKPSQWEGKLQYKSNEISEILRNLYDRNGADRGNGHDVIQYALKAPLFLVGEETFAGDEKACYDRSAISFLTREGRDIVGASSSMEYLKKNKNLIMRLGKLIYMASLGLTNEEFNKLYESAQEQGKAFKSMLTEYRVYDSLITIITGFNLFNKVCADMDLSPIEVNVKLIAFSLRDYCQNGKEATLSEIDKFFAALDEIYDGNAHSKIIGYNTKGCFYHLNLKTIYKDISEFKIKEVLGYGVLTRPNLLKQLKAKGWLLFDGKSNAQRVLGEENPWKGYSIKADELRKLDLSIFN